MLFGVSGLLLLLLSLLRTLRTWPETIKVISIDIKNRHVNYQLRCNAPKPDCVGKRQRLRTPLQLPPKGAQLDGEGKQSYVGNKYFPRDLLMHLNSQWENKAIITSFLWRTGLSSSNTTSAAPLSPAATPRSPHQSIQQLAQPPSGSKGCGRAPTQPKGKGGAPRRG